MVFTTFLALVLSLFLDLILANPRCFPPQTTQPPDHRDCFSIVVDDIISNPISSKTVSFVAGNIQSNYIQYRLPHVIRNPTFPHCEIWIGAHRRGQKETFKYLELAHTAMRIMNTCMLEHEAKAGQEDVFSGGLVYVRLIRPVRNSNEEPLLAANNTGIYLDSPSNTTTIPDTQ